MKKYFSILLFAVGLLLPNTISFAATSVSGTISSSTTWMLSGSPYILENLVTVPAGISLTIEPGVVVKGTTSGQLVVYGTLSAIGTPEGRIIFTSYFDDEYGGDSDGTGATVGVARGWRGIRFMPDSSGNFVDILLRYAGDLGSGTQSGVDNDGGTLEMTDSSITDNFLRGIYQRSGSVTLRNSIVERHTYGIQSLGGNIDVRNSTIKDNTGLGIDAYGTDSISLIGNAFSGNHKTARIDALSNFTHSGNTSADITNKGFAMAGVVDTDTTWHSSDLPLIIDRSSSLRINSGAILTISPGTVLKLGTSGYIIVQGSLSALATADSKIYITSIRDDSIGGDTNGDGAATTAMPMDWNGIEFRNGSAGNLLHTAISYAGGYNGIGRAAIFNFGGNLTANKVSFSNNLFEDVYQTVGTTTISYSGFISTGTTYAVFNSGSNPVDARNNWWGSSTGPYHSSNPTGIGARVSNNVLFNPWLSQYPPPDPIATTTPVIIVPGIMSTELLEDNFVDDLIWPDTTQLVSSISDNFLDVLKMDINGDIINENIKIGRIIRSLNNANYFDGLFNQLSIFFEDIDLFENPYDWRLDVQISALKLKEKIDQVKIDRGVDKVDLVAHSMGGLLVKKYLEDYGGDSIDKFIDLGTPHLGAPSAYKILMYGDNLGVSKFFGLINLNTNKIKEISQNMPAVYQLLPSQAYFNDYEYYVFDAASGDDRLTFSQTSQYLKDSGRNANLVDRANALHQEIDDLDPTDYGVETYNFVGCGTPTIGQFYIIQEGEHPIYNIRMINGDGTVPLKSAEAISAKTYYVKGAQHALMPSTSGVKDVISQILTSTSTPDISPYSNLATTANGCDIPNGKIVSFHSPIELHVYDSSGNHSGPDNNGDIENEISGVVYEVIGDNKFAFLPDGANYQVQGVPADTGTFDVRIETVTDGEVSSLSYWNGLPVGGVSFLVGEEVPNTILDVPPSAVLNGVQALDLVKPVTELSIKGNKISEDSYISSVQFSLSATDDNAGVLKTEYSLDGGHTWDIYSKPVVVNEKGGVELMYRSVDKAGNVEVIKSKIINIIWPGNSGKKR